MSNSSKPLDGASRVRPRIRVMQAIGSLHFGGAERLVAHLATGIDRNRFDMTVCCTREAGEIGEQIAASGVKVVALGTPRRRSRYGIPINVLRLLRAYSPQVIHSHGLVPLTEVGPLAYLGALPYWIHTFHFGNYPYSSGRQMWLERVLARRASELVAVADAQRNDIVRYHHFPSDRIRVVPNGVSPNPLLDHPDVRHRMRQEFGFMDDEIVVASISVLSEQKGLEYFLRAAAEVAERYPNVKFLVVGGGPLEMHLRSRAGQLGIQERVQFTGWRADVQELLLAIDIYVMSSLWEAMPLSLLEAMASRRAIVVTDVGNNSEIAASGSAALVTPPRDAAAIADAICRLVADPTLARTLASGAYKRFMSKYTAEMVVEAYQALYERASSRGDAARSRQ